MNLYVLTQNSFLAHGLHNFFTHNKVDWKISNHDNKSIQGVLSTCSEDDVIIYIADGLHLEFLTLMGLHMCKAMVFISETEIDWGITCVFNFTVLPNKFSFKDLLLRINKRHCKNKQINIPKFSPIEKKILMLILQEVPMECISNRLGKPIKTVYTHRLKAFKKLGIRRAHHLSRIPADYVNRIMSK